MGMDKGLLELAGKPLLKHVIDSIKDRVDQIVVVTNSQDRANNYSSLPLVDVQFAVDQSDIQSPLIGAMSGFSFARWDYSLLVPFDAPFISSQIVSLLFEICIGKAACVPKHPNGQIEPLCAVYRTGVAQECSGAAVTEGRRDMRGMIEKMREVRYVSTLVLQQMDPELRTFVNINTRADLKKAEILVRQQKRADR
jgi:molybdopterin-guanine dinucleotide biosynthesis protein A